MKAYAGEKQPDMGFEANILPGVNDKSNVTMYETFALPRDVSCAKNHQPSDALVILTVNLDNLDLIQHQKNT